MSTGDQTFLLPSTKTIAPGWTKKFKNNSQLYKTVIQTADGDQLLEMHFNSESTFKCMGGFYIFIADSSQSITCGVFDVYTDDNNNTWVMQQYLNQSYGQITMTSTTTTPPPSSGRMYLKNKCNGAAECTTFWDYTSFLHSDDDPGNWDVSYTIFNDIYGNSFQNNAVYNLQSNNLSVNPYVMNAQSGKTQVITGSVTSGKVQLPSLTQYGAGVEYRIINQNTNSISIYSDGTTNIGTVPTGSTAVCVCTATGTPATWTVTLSNSTAPVSGVTSLTGDGVLINNSSSTGAVTLTRPTVAVGNSFYASADNTANTTPTFRQLVGRDLPNPTTIDKGGVQAVTPVTNNWVNSINTSGVPQLSQPAFSNISGTVASTQLPTPTNTTLGGVKSNSTVSNQWLTQIDTTGTPQLSQPAFSNISGNATVAQGGTGLTSTTTYGLLAGGTTSTGNLQQVTTLGTSGQVLTSNGAGALPSFQSSPANVSSITGDGVLINNSSSTGAVTLTKPTVATGNSFYASADNTANTTPTFRQLVGRDLPNPTTIDKGGVQAVTPVTNNWVNSINTSGVPQLSQPAFSNISGTVASTQLPTPTNTTLGGVKSNSTVSNQWLTQIDTTGTPQLSQPAFSNISGNATVAQGGTGLTSTTTYGLLAGGTTSTGNLQQVTTLGTSGQVLTSNGAGALPSFQSSPANVSSITGDGVLINNSSSTGAVTLTKPTVAVGNSFYASADNTANTTPTFRQLVGRDLPNPTTIDKGGVQAVTPVTNNWVNSINTSGVPQLSQPAFSNISGTVASTQLPTPTNTTLGGVKSNTATTSNWIRQIDTTGTPQLSQPTFTDISGTTTLSQLPTGASNTVLSGGTTPSYKSLFQARTYNNSGGTLTLLYTDLPVQIITGSTGTLDILLPDSALCQIGQTFIVINNSSNNVRLVDSGGSNLMFIYPMRVGQAFNFSNTSAFFWYFVLLPSNLSGNQPVLDGQIGGTGVTSFTAGDLLYAASTSSATSPFALSKLGIGSNGTQLISNGSVPSWGYSITPGVTNTNMSANLVMTNTSTPYQFISVYSSGNLLLPDGSTCIAGQIFTIRNATASNIPMFFSNGSTAAFGGTLYPQTIIQIMLTTVSTNNWRVSSVSSSLPASGNLALQISAGGLGINTWPAANSLLLTGSTVSASSIAQIVTGTSGGAGIPLISGSTSTTAPTFGAALVIGGGTGLTSTTAYGLIAGGTTSTGNLQQVATGTSGQPLLSGGSSALPTFGTVGVAGGGSGLSTLTTYALLTGGTTSTGALQQVATGTSGQVLISGGSSALPSFGSLTVGGGGTGRTSFPVNTLIAGGTTTGGTLQQVSNSSTPGIPVISGATSGDLPLFGVAKVAGGGTGLNSVASNSLLLGSGGSTLNTLSIGSDTNILQIVSGVPNWVSTSQGTGTVSITSTGTSCVLSGVTSGYYYSFCGGGNMHFTLWINWTGVTTQGTGDLRVNVSPGNLTYNTGNGFGTYRATLNNDSRNLSGAGLLSSSQFLLYDGSHFTTPGATSDTGVFTDFPSGYLQITGSLVSS